MIKLLRLGTSALILASSFSLPALGLVVLEKGDSLFKANKTIHEDFALFPHPNRREDSNTPSAEPTQASEKDVRSLCILFPSDPVCKAQEIKIIRPDGPDEVNDFSRTEVRKALYQKQRRFALVVGNGSYSHAPLRNPVHDAIDMKVELESLGFEVKLIKNATFSVMLKEIDRFHHKLKQTPESVGFFYYSQ